MTTGVPDQDVWHPARLMPVVGIRNTDEQEKRATSALIGGQAPFRRSDTRCGAFSADNSRLVRLFWKPDVFG